MNIKTELLNAFLLERKAQEIYDKVWCEFTDKQKTNIQATLILVFFTGDAQYKLINDKYRDDITKLTADELKHIQCFHRSAMALGRRKKKETDNADELLQLQSNRATDKAPANTVSPSNQKESRVPSDKEKTGERKSKPKNPELLITEAIELITRPDVKAILMLALQQMKLTTTVTDFTEPADMSFIDTHMSDEYIEENKCEGVWW